MTDSKLLLDLYRAARERESGVFEESAIALLKQWLGFESAIWGTGLLRKDGGVSPHTVHMHEQPRESIQEWAHLNVADPVAKACMAQPGVPIRFHAPTLFAAHEAAPMRGYAKRYGRQSYMVCGLRYSEQPDFVAWLSLYRSDPEAHFTEGERWQYQAAIQHLHEAQQINRQLQLHRALGPVEHKEVLAIADVFGYLHTPWSDVQELLSGEWPKLQPGRLPSPLVEALAAPGEGRYEGRALRVRSRQSGGLLFLRLCRFNGFGTLSVRERQIADAIARGQSAKEVAKAFGLSPATVRVHLRNIYEKLGLHRRAELGHIVGANNGEAAERR